MKKFIMTIVVLAGVLMSLPMVADEVVASASGGWFAVDAREVKDTTLDGAAITGAVEVAWSGLWSGDAESTVSVKVVDGETLVDNATGEGLCLWTPTHGGNFTLQHITTGGDTLTAKFFVATYDIGIDDGTGGSGGSASSFSYNGVYDGQGHGIAVSVSGNVNPTVKYALAKDGAYVDELLLTNVCDKVTVWYTVEAGGYNTYTNNATVTITPLAVTVKSKDRGKVYDGTALMFGADGVEIAGAALPVGESFVYSNFASITDVGQTAATFTIAAGANTKLANYTITPVYGNLTVTKAKIGGDDGEEPGDGEVPEGGLSKFDAEHVFNGEEQTIDVEELEAALAATMHGDYVVEYAFGGDNGEEPSDDDWWGEAPGIRNVGEAVVWYRVLSDNYDAFVHAARVQVTPKPVTVEMLVYSDDGFFFDGNNTKVPDVLLEDTNSQGVVISTDDDYTRSFGERNAETGEYPVTIIGRNNYIGTVTKSFKPRKPAVAPPIIGSMSYNGRNRKPTIPDDPRWEVIANPGGIDAGVYSNVVLTLTHPEDYMWRGSPEDEPYWRGVFTITKAGNGWSRVPAINSWTSGVGTVELGMGQPRYGTTSYVTYRVRGADPETATRTVPTTSGQYTARFVVEESANYMGTYKDVDFEIYPGAIPPAEDDGELQALIAIDGQNEPVITWRWTVKPSDPDVPRTYIILGKKKLDDLEWVPVTDGNRDQMRFFKVRAVR